MHEASLAAGKQAAAVTLSFMLDDSCPDNGYDKGDQGAAVEGGTCPPPMAASTAN